MTLAGLIAEHERLECTLQTCCTDPIVALVVCWRHAAVSSLHASVAFPAPACFTVPRGGKLEASRQAYAMNSYQGFSYVCVSVLSWQALNNKLCQRTNRFKLTGGHVTSAKLLRHALNFGVDLSCRAAMFGKSASGGHCLGIACPRPSLHSCCARRWGFSACFASSARELPSWSLSSAAEPIWQMRRCHSQYENVVTCIMKALPQRSALALPWWTCCH